MSSPQPTSLGQITRDLLSTIEPPGKAYYLLLTGVVAVLGFGIFSWMWQIRWGLGVAGYANSVWWAVYITNFVFWVGIAHCGTLISAILYLFRSRWRTSISRASEAMTVFAVMTAGLFPIIHLGRPWYFYWLIPYPNQRGIWVNFKSPLIWDLFAILTYLTVSSVFLYVGLIPDIAVARDRAQVRWRKKLYTLLSLGWQGTHDQWQHFNRAYLYLAALATPLVISVHSVVSWDFAVSIVPGWHTTIFAPYFVAGAIFSGCALVVTLLVPLRKVFRLEAYVTEDNFDNLGKIILFTSLIVTYAYVMEFFMAWYSGPTVERASFYYRAFGDFWWATWIMIFCNSVAPLALWSHKVRTSIPVIFVVSILVNIGMWFERFVIIVTSLAHEYMPYRWGTYAPRWPEYGITAGSFAWFFMWYLLFIKGFPLIPLAEMKEHFFKGRKGEAR